MAKFKRKAKRRFSPFRRSRSRSNNSSGSLTAVLVGGAAYGAGRQYVSNLVKPLTDKIPLGNVADNLVMGAICYFGAKKAPKMLKPVFKAGLAIEAAMAGQDLMQNGLSSVSGSSQSNFTPDNYWG